MKGLNVISAHVAAIVSTLSANVALLHPGFTVAPWVQYGAFVVGMAIAGTIEVIHLVTHRKLAVTLAQIEAWGKNVISAAPAAVSDLSTASTAPNTPAPKPVAAKK